MAVRRDKNGIWRYRKVVQLSDGTKVRISGTPSRNTKQEAERAERAHIDRTLNPPPEQKEVLTFRRFVEDRWWPTYPKAAGNRHTTVREKRGHLDRHLLPVLGKVPLDQVRDERVDKLFAALVDKGLSPKTRKNVRATLRRILASAVEWGLLDAVPMLPRVKVPDAPRDALTQEEAAELLDSARGPEAQTMLLFALHTGARAGEQLALEWGDIDFRNGFVVIRRSSTDGVVTTTKSGRERRVPLTAALRKALKAHKHLRGALVFCDEDGSPMNRYQLHERLWTACRRSGLRKVRWHDLRHSFATQLVARGVPLRQVQGWLGHSTAQMTERYAHLQPHSGADLIGVLDEPVSRGRGNDVATDC